MVVLTIAAQKNRAVNSEQASAEQGNFRKPSKMKQETIINRPANIVPQRQNRSRWLISRDIREKLLKMPNYTVFDWIDFTVKRSGTVVLRGDVLPGSDIKAEVEAIVKTVDGVGMIFNDIRELPYSLSDKKLRRALSKKFFTGQLSGYKAGASKQIHIIVNRRHIRLEGVVRSQSDKNMAGRYARKISGLFYVDNQLVVAGQKRRLY